MVRWQMRRRACDAGRGSELMRRTVSGLAILALAAAALAASSRPAAAATAPPDTSRLPDAKMYLTWHAPFGQPGASDALVAACGDTTSKDTLYMCFDPGQDIDTFQSLTATLYFWASSGDTLDPHWFFGEGQGFHGLQVEYAPEGVAGTEPAWAPSSAYASSGYSKSKASGKLRMIAAGPSGHGWPLKGGTTYVAARLLVPRAANKGRGCDAPVCIEWSLALLGIGEGRLPEVKSGQRFVSWNSRGGKVCSAMRSFAAPQPWQPKQTLPPGWKSP